MTEANLRSVELKAFVPARDYERSLAFYVELGFECAWRTDEMACLRHGPCAFLLQNFHVPEHAANFVMSWLVEDADAWWARVRDAGVIDRYGVRAEPPADQPWGMRDFVLFDPGGVLWRIGHPLPRLP